MNLLYAVLFVTSGALGISTLAVACRGAAAAHSIDNIASGTLMSVAAGTLYTGLIAMVAACKRDNKVSRARTARAACELSTLLIATVLGIFAAKFPIAQYYTGVAGFLMFLGGAASWLGQLAAIATRWRDELPPPDEPSDWALVHDMVRTVVATAAVCSGGAVPAIAAAWFMCVLRVQFE